MAEMDRLEARLTALAHAVTFPPTPNLTAAVRSRLEPRPRSQRRWVWALAAALLLAVTGGVVAMPQARETVAGWLGIKGVNIQRVEHPPPPSMRPSGPIGSRLGLGQPETLAEAERLAGFKIQIPADLGPPDEVFYRSDAGAVTLVYYPRAGLPEANQTGAGALVTVLKATLQGPILNKVIGPGTQLQQTDVAGTAAYWLSGSPHDVFYTDSRGAFRQDTLRLATNTLLWQRGELTYRLEAPIDLNAARTIAASVA